MDNFPQCQICNKHFTQHVPTLNCTTCNNLTHISCLPLFTDNELEIAKNPENHWSCPICISNFFPFHDLENLHDLVNTLAGNDPINLDFLENLVFDVLEPIHEGGANEDIDPDEGFFNQQTRTSSKCTYIHPDP
jgi:hypothetical protein